MSKSSHYYYYSTTIIVFEGFKQFVDQTFLRIFRETDMRERERQRDSSAKVTIGEKLLWWWVLCVENVFSSPPPLLLLDLTQVLMVGEDGSECRWQVYWTCMHIKLCSTPAESFPSNRQIKQAHTTLSLWLDLRGGNCGGGQDSFWRQFNWQGSTWAWHYFKDYQTILDSHLIHTETHSCICLWNELWDVLFNKIKRIQTKMALKLCSNIHYSSWCCQVQDKT